MSEAEFYVYRRVSLEGDKQIPINQITGSLLQFWLDHYKNLPNHEKNHNRELLRRKNEENISLNRIQMKY